MKNSFNYLSLLLSVVLISIMGNIVFEAFSGAFTKHASWVHSVDINNENIIASADDAGILLWDKKHCIAQLTDEGGMVKTLSYSHNGQLIASGSLDNYVKIWSVKDKKQVKELRAGKASKVIFDRSDKYVITNGYKENIKIWDWKQGKVVKEIARLNNNTIYTDFSISDNNILAYLDTGCIITLFNLNTLKEAASLPGYCATPHINPDGKTIAIKPRGPSIYIINAKDGTLITAISNHNDLYAFEPFAFNQKWLANGISGNRVELWDWQKNKLIKTVGKAALSGFEDVALRNNNLLLTAGGDRSVKVWNIETGDLLLDIGTATYQSRLFSILSVAAIITLVFGFFGIIYSSENSFSSFSLRLVLSVWSFGTLFLLFLIKPPIIKYATALAWVLTILSGLFILSLYGAFLTLYTLPFGLFFGYQQMMYDRERKGTYLPTFINLIFCGFICYLKFFKN